MLVAEVIALLAEPIYFNVSIGGGKVEFELTLRRRGAALTTVVQCRRMQYIYIYVGVSK